jgi:hypothetical protein
MRRNEEASHAIELEGVVFVMPPRPLTLDYDGEQVTYQVEGQTSWGDARVLLDEDDDLIVGRPWAPDGFVVAPFLAPDAIGRIVDGVRALLMARIRDAGIEVPDAFALDRYHEVVTTDEAHRRVSERGPWCYGIADLPVPVESINARISEILGAPVSTRPPHTEFPEHFCIRVVRPRSRDNNPPHRDVWLDRLRHGVNIYAPLAGSSSRSSLPLIQGSHRWSEADIERTTAGALVGGVSFTVPAVVGARHPLALVRPDPGPNEVLVFSPYLIHGGAFNQQADRTRVSLEMRFWRRR